jgi:hypothetical protein
VASTRADHPLRVQYSGNRIAHPLDCGVVSARGDKHWDAGIAQNLERWRCIGGVPTPVRALNSTDDLGRKRPVGRHGRARDLEELAQLGRLHREPLGQGGFAQPPEGGDLGIVCR